MTSVNRLDILTNTVNYYFMDLILTRKHFRSDGIFSVLMDKNGKILAMTLEHAYLDLSSKSYAPKIPDGKYKCVLGHHRLEKMKNDFETFEITNVPGHSNILFHVGNFNYDSEGCVLLGSDISKGRRRWSIKDSATTFSAFMKIQSGIDQFNLNVY